MFVVKAFWAIFAFVQIECILQGTYFTPVEIKTDTQEAMKQIPSSSTIACVVTCKNEPGCKESGLSGDKTCHLFNTTVKEHENGGTVITVFKDKMVGTPETPGTPLIYHFDKSTASLFSSLIFSHCHCILKLPIISLQMGVTYGGKHLWVFLKFFYLYLCIESLKCSEILYM